MGDARVPWFGREKDPAARQGWATPGGPPAPAADATALLERIGALGLDDARTAFSEPEVLWARGWEPPALTAHAAVLEIAQGAADAVALEPLDLDGAERLLRRLAPLSPVMQALVALRCATYEERNADAVAYHGSELADALGWAGELLDRADVARGSKDPQEAWRAASMASRWCGSLAGKRYPHPDHAELLQPAAAFCSIVADASYATDLVTSEGATVPVREVAELSVCLGAALLRAVAADLPAAAALLAGAKAVDGLRLLPAASVPVASLLEYAQDPRHTDFFWRVNAPGELTWAVRDLSVACEQASAAWHDNPARDPHGDFPPDDAFDAPAMDRAEAEIERIARGTETALAAEPDPPVVAELAHRAVAVAHVLRAPRGWASWGDQAAALQSLGRLTARLHRATTVARWRSASPSGR